MPSFKTSLCRTPGGFLTLPDFTGADIVADAYAASLAQFLQMGVLCTVLPAMLYWQYRRRRWWTMGVALATFVLALDHLMLKDHGSMWQTLAATMILCGPLYLLLAAFWAVLVRMGRAVGGGVGGGAVALSLSERIALGLLAVAAHLSFFIAATIADFAGAAMLGAMGDVVNCLYHLARPVDFRSHGDHLNMLLAVLPTLVLAMLLQGWLRRRRTIRSRAPLLLLR